MPSHGVGIENFTRHELLRGGHQPGVGPGRIARHGIGGLRRGVRPVLSQPGRTARSREHGERIDEIGVQHRVMLDHRQHARIAQQGGATQTETPTARGILVLAIDRHPGIAQFQKLERSRGAQQSP